MQTPINNEWGEYLCPATVAPGSVCVMNGDSSLIVVRSSGTETIALHLPNAAGYGAVRISGDGRYLAYGAYVGEFDSGYYVTTIVDLSTKKTVSTVRNFAPEVWLPDDRLVGWDNDYPE